MFSFEISALIAESVYPPSATSAIRTRLRITAAPGSIGKPPSRTTRSPSARFPGVRPDHQVSKTMNQPKKITKNAATASAISQAPRFLPNANRAISGEMSA